MNIYQQYRDHVIAAFQELIINGELPEDIEQVANFEAIVAEPPRDALHGDIAINAAMVVAKKAGMNPRALAELLKLLLLEAPHVTAVEVAGPGFINLRL